MKHHPKRVPPDRLVARIAAAVLVAALAGVTAASAATCDSQNEWFTRWFKRQECAFSNTGGTPYFSLQPGHWVLLRGYDDGEHIRLLVRVLDEVELVDGVMTRVIEEREWANNELVEVSRNFFAVCAPRNDVFYFGEDVDNYEDGQIVDHEGSWRAGEDGARPGILMPGSFLLGARYYQEFAPEQEALDRACNKAMNKKIWTHMGYIHNCVGVLETTPLEPGEESFKGYCPGIGLVRDDNVRLVTWSGAAPAGFLEKAGYLP